MQKLLSTAQLRCAEMILDCDSTAQLCSTEPHTPCAEMILDCASTAQLCSTELHTTQAEITINRTTSLYRVTINCRLSIALAIECVSNRVQKITGNC